MGKIKIYSDTHSVSAPFGLHHIAPKVVSAKGSSQPCLCIVKGVVLAMCKTQFCPTTLIYNLAHSKRIHSHAQTPKATRTSSTF